MLRTRTLAAAVAASLVLAVGTAQAVSFPAVYVFGDSLSDAGQFGARFTTNPGTVTVQNIATFFGQNLTPSTTGGTDFAFGGAGILNNSPGTPPGVPLMPAQLQMYLSASNGQANPNALYMVWGGANDIFFNAYMTSIGQITPQTAQMNVILAAQAEGGMLGTLKAAGAKYIMVFNLPNIGITPDATAQGPAAEAALTGLSITFNSTLSAAIQQVNPGINVIPINVYALVNEVLADPSSFGFTNVTVPACTTASSLTCTPSTLVSPNAPQTYFFADGVHPTTAAHAMLAQYAESIVLAPGQQSLLAETPLAAYGAHQRSIRNQTLLDTLGAVQPGVHVFADYSYAHQRFNATINTPRTVNNNNVLTMGINAVANQNLSLGMALGVAKMNAGESGMGSFKTQDLMFSGFANYNMGAAYFGGSATVGQLTFSNINRYIRLGPALRTETSKTNGSQLALKLNSGYWFKFGTMRTGPFVSLTWQRIKVDPYHEEGNDASAMWFGRQTRRSTEAQLGWQLLGQMSMGTTTLHPFARLSYVHDSSANARLVSAGLVTMAGTFAMPGFIPDKNWANADLGVLAQFSPGLSGYVSYTGMFSNTNEKLNSLNLGVRLRF